MPHLLCHILVCAVHVYLCCMNWQFNGSVWRYTSPATEWHSSSSWAHWDSQASLALTVHSYVNMRLINHYRKLIYVLRVRDSEIHLWLYSGVAGNVAVWAVLWRKTMVKQKHCQPFSKHSATSRFLGHSCALIHSHSLVNLIRLSAVTMRQKETMGIKTSSMFLLH